MTRPRYRISPGNGVRPDSLEPADDADGSLLGPEPRCPECGSYEVSERHAEPTFALPETDWQQCDDCDHQWGHQ